MNYLISGNGPRSTIIYNSLLRVKGSVRFNSGIERENAAEEKKSYYGRQLLSKNMMQSYSSMRSCHNAQFNYKPYFMTLNTIDPILYEIIEKFWDNWMLLDINSETAGMSATEIVDEFMKKLNRYIHTA